MRIGVTGGTGFIGSHLIELLLRKGHHIECLAMKGDAPGWLKDNDSLIFTEGDLLDPPSMVGFVKRNMIIIHLAGITRAKNESDFYTFNLEGTNNLVETIKLENHHIQQLIIMSSQAVVGPSHDGKFLEEDAPFNPISPYGRSKASMENYLYNKCSSLPITIIRAPSVYGPRDKDFIQLMKIINRGIKPIIGKNSLISFVYVKNLVEGIHAAIMAPEALGETFFLTDDGAYTWMEFGSFIEKGLGKKALAVYIPMFIIKIASSLSILYSFLTKKSILLTKNKVEEITTPFWLVSNAKARRILNYFPHLNTEEGILESIKWYQKNGFL